MRRAAIVVLRVLTIISCTAAGMILHARGEHTLGWIVPLSGLAVAIFLFWLEWKLFDSRR